VLYSRDGAADTCDGGLGRDRARIDAKRDKLKRIEEVLA